MLKGKKIGFIITDSFYNFHNIIPKIRELVKRGAKIMPIISLNSQNEKINKFIDEIKNITFNQPINSIEEASKLVTDIMVIAPCNGNTIAKLASNIEDTPAVAAIQSHLKNENNVIIAIAANNALSTNAVNIGILLNRKHFYFVPVRQNNPITKPYSISFDSEYLIPTIEHALFEKQIQPMLLWNIFSLFYKKVLTRTLVCFIINT